MRKRADSATTKLVGSTTGHATTIERAERFLNRSRIRIFVPLLILVAFACAGGESTDNLPGDCDAYVSATQSCYGMTQERALDMRQVLRSRLANASTRDLVVAECEQGAAQLSTVCHGR